MNENSIERMKEIYNMAKENTDLIFGIGFVGAPNPAEYVPFKPEDIEIKDGYIELEIDGNITMFPFDTVQSVHLLK